ncbi:MAG: PLP-dependent aminotransferase family protein [Bordetella sp.]|nr:MAG: PLP-dependent aminotransferase family protein [Bordetella sp.]
MDNFVIPECTFSERSKQLTNSAIRRILKVTESPKTISFAGGLPAPKGFPVTVIQSAFNKVLSQNGYTALQYSPTEGYYPLREWIANEASQFCNCSIKPEQILIVSGSQQALDLLSKIFIDHGSNILIENPSYIGALQSFNLYKPNYIPLPTDNDGLISDSITPDLAKICRFLYVLPNFQNPTGQTLNFYRRVHLVKLSEQFQFPIIEDDPYGDLRFIGTPQPTLFSLSNKYGGNIIHLGSFSKILAPGLRLGYILASKHVIDKLVQAKQATDLHTSTLTQMAVYEILKTGFIKKHLTNIRQIYREQSISMINTMEKKFPKEVSWTRPEGGMFLWVTLPTQINSTKLLKKAIEKNVVFVPGEFFYSEKSLTNTLRLSFSTVPEEKILEGISILGKLLDEY